MKFREPFIAVVVAVVFGAAATACSGDDGDDTTAPSSASTTIAPAREVPAGPAADVSEEITGDTAPFIGEAATPDFDALGLVQREYIAAGTATAYKEAKGELASDGRWTFVATTEAPYRTRVLVRRPADASRANGTVVVEWLNVSGGVDADPDYTSIEEELVRKGITWVGVSTQRIGIEGGPVIVKVAGGEEFAGKGLKKIDPQRYGSLEHPGDGYSFDIYTQVARAIRAGALADVAPPQNLLAIGESQSAVALVTYYNGVQPLNDAFDGFLVHSRGGVSLPLVGRGEYADLAGAIAGAKPAILRTDLDTPVLDVQMEGDLTSVLNSIAARQPDSNTFRLWEVAGTAHADTRLVGAYGKGIECGAPINNGPAHLVVKAALRHLDAWVRDGTLPPIAPRLTTTDAAPPAIQRNADGIAQGGVRTPPVDVPVDVHSGVPGPNPEIICILLGSTKPLSADRIAELYPSRAAYEEQYAASADEAIAAGFVLADDRAALDAYADPDRIQD